MFRSPMSLEPAMSLVLILIFGGGGYYGRGRWG
jgi:hypothetical protein